MKNMPPIDLVACWDAHKADVLADRDPKRISGSDLHGCDRALWGRTHGEAQLPYDNSSFSAFERGHAYETRTFDALQAFVAKLPQQMTAERFTGDALVFEGVEGHPDFLLKDSAGALIAVIDPTTTASKFTEWKYPHALKSAFYAVALGCETFCEWTFSIGFGGNILKNEPHWFSLDDVPFTDTGLTWRDLVALAVAHAKAVVALDAAPEPIPAIDPQDGTRELWRCKAYCRAVCPANKRLSPMSGAA